MTFCGLAQGVCQWVCFVTPLAIEKMWLCCRWYLPCLRHSRSMQKSFQLQKPPICPSSWHMRWLPPWCSRLGANPPYKTLNKLIHFLCMFTWRIYKPCLLSLPLVRALEDNVFCGGIFWHCISCQFSLPLLCYLEEIFTFTFSTNSNSDFFCHAG